MKDGFKIALGGILSVLTVVLDIVVRVLLPILVALFVLKIAGMVTLGWLSVIIAPALLYLVATLLHATCSVLLKRSFK